MLRNRRQDMNGEAIGLREVTSDEIGTRFHERANEMDITREAVKLNNY